MINHLRTTLMNLVTRGRVIANAVLFPSRTVLTMTGRAGETMQNVELLQPYGMSSRPTAGDTLFFQIGGTRDHLVAVHCDDPALRIQDLQPGEFGWRDLNGQQIVFRQDHIEVTSPNQDITINAPNSNTNVFGNNVNVHASTSYANDVNGYGQRLTWTGGNTFLLDTYTTGADVTSIEHGFTPSGPIP